MKLVPDLRAPGKDPIRLEIVHPGDQTQKWYARKLGAAVDAMRATYQRKVAKFYAAALKANEAVERVQVALDADPDKPERPGPKATGARDDLFAEMAELQKFWSGYFDDFAKKIADDFLSRAMGDNTRSWQHSLKRAGFDIKLNPTPSQTLILKAKTRENVALIKSIPERFHTDIEGSVMRAFVAGRDLAALQAELRKTGHSTKDRSAFIALDQANKASAAFSAARQRELGLKWASWVHGYAGKEPRPDHVRAYKEGWYYDTQVGIDFGDKFGHVLPGEAIRCRCTGRTVVMVFGSHPGFDEARLEAVPGFPGAYRMPGGKAQAGESGTRSDRPRRA